MGIAFRISCLYRMNRRLHMYVSFVGKSKCFNGMEGVMWIIDRIQSEDNVTMVGIVCIPVKDRLRHHY